MRKYILSSIFALAFLFGITLEAKAVRAYPYPIAVTQPDGTTITIQVHGDEFLNWTTSGGNLVAKGKDGFFYLASFLPDGSKQLSSTRAASGLSMTKGLFSSSVTPPASAIAYALKLRQQLSHSAPAASISTGSKPFLVLLIEFSDLQFTVEDAYNAYNDMLTQAGYSANQGTGSAYDYYYENSRGQFDPQFELVGPIKVSKGYEYYSKDKGMETPGARELLIEACDSIDGTIDFSRYDNDNDGIIDNIFYYFAGHNMAEGADGTIWPHKWVVSGTHVYDGVQLYTYACTSEYSGASGTRMCGIGTFCHEFGHVIGLPDFYDTAEGNAPGPGAYSLMCSGNYNNKGRTPPYLSATERNLLGWMDMPPELTANNQYSLESIDRNVAYYTPTNNPGEYYIYENRQKVDGTWDKYIPGHGLLIYHVDKSNNMVNGYTAKIRWEYGYDINGDASHECYDLIEAGGKNKDESNTPFPGASGNTSYTGSTTPGNIAWDGYSTGYELTNIAEDNGVITFDLNIKSDITVSGTVTNTSGVPISGAVVSLTRTEISGSKDIASSPKLTSSPFRTTSEEYTVTTGADGTFTINAEQGGNFLVKVSSEGYADYMNTFEFSKGTFSINITMNTPIENLNKTLVKHDKNRSSNLIGTGAQPFSGKVAVGFRPEELTSVSGYTFESISFRVVGSAADKIEVFVLIDGQEVLTKTADNPNFGSEITVNVSSEGVSIPKGQEVWIGYNLVNIDNGHPISSDDTPMKDLGFMIDMGDGIWYDIKEASDGGLDCNAWVSAVVKNNDNLFKALGYNAILSPKASYTAGESLTPELAINKEIQSSEIYFDGRKLAAGETIVLTAGEHIISAELTYSTGLTETITQEIIVK